MKAVIQRVTFVLDSRREERIADSVWQEKNERSVVSSGHKPYAICSFSSGLRSSLFREDR